MNSVELDETILHDPALKERTDFAAIAAWIKPGSKVLDLGCGDGALLRYLKQSLSVRGYGVEIDDANILACIKNGVNVIQNDLETGLSGFESNSFDYVILSQTLQAMRHTESIVKEILRVGRQGIVTFPNFGYWRALAGVQWPDAGVQKSSLPVVRHTQRAFVHHR